MNWTAVRQGFADVVAQLVAFRQAHPVLVNNFGCFLAGLILGFCVGH